MNKDTFAKLSIIDYQYHSSKIWAIIPTYLSTQRGWAIFLTTTTVTAKVVVQIFTPGYTAQCSIFICIAILKQGYRLAGNTNKVRSVELNMAKKHVKFIQ